MKNLICITIALLLSAGTVQAQSFLDKLDRTLDKVDRAANSADKAGKTGSKLAGFLTKEKSKDKTDMANTAALNITIQGGTFSTLSKLNEKIKTCKGVENTKLNYNSAGSSIAVSTKLSGEELINAIKQAGAITDDNITGLDEKSISLNIK